MVQITSDGSPICGHPLTSGTLTRLFQQFDETLTSFLESTKRSLETSTESETLDGS